MPVLKFPLKEQQLEIFNRRASTFYSIYGSYTSGHPDPEWPLSNTYALGSTALFQLFPNSCRPKCSCQGCEGLI